MEQLGKRISLKNYMEKNPIHTVRVCRPSKWGNPFKLTDYSLEKSLKKYEIWLKNKLENNPNFLTPLKDKNLACYCKIDQPCHVDILLKYLESESE